MALEALDIVKDGATAAGFAKILVDVVKLLPIPSPGSVLPILAFLFAEACAFLLFLAGDSVASRQTIAITVLIGIAATGGAILATGLQTKADQVAERVDVALSLPKGSTVEDVDKRMNKQ